MSSEKRPLIIIAGPTAVGKTESSLKLAEAVNGEIVSADSMQVYRYMDIGSAKIRKEEMRGIPHHLIDVLDPREPYNVTLFQQMAYDAMEGIYQRGHVPVLTGGTGFYIQAVLYAIDFTENDGDDSYRKELERKAASEGGNVLYEQLQKEDPEAAEAIGPFNTKRIIRALEFKKQTGMKISEHNEKERGKESPFDFEYYVLTREREELYSRIEQRVDLMMEQGLLDEVRFLKEYGCRREMTSMQGLGYKQLMAYLDGECTLPEAVERIKIETRHFAKRQLTWFRHERQVTEVDLGKEDLYSVFRDGHLGCSLTTW